jgi:Pentapeptide repeats (8 copies)
MSHIHLGQDYYNIDGRIIRINDSVRFCNLRDANFKQVNLSGVEFLGCRFNGASFVDANLDNTKFIGCFIGDDYDPMYMEDDGSKAVFIDCHLPYYAMLGRQAPVHTWDAEIAEVATRVLSRDSARRYHALEKLQELGDPVVAPFLASCLIDEEWEVVLIALRTLMKLRKQSFPHHDPEIMSWIMFSLGHENSIVRDEAQNIVQKIKPDDQMLIPVLAQMQSWEPARQLAGLLAAGALYRIDESNLRLIDVAGLEPLLFGREPAIRDECLHLLGMIDAPPPTQDWLLRGLHDPTLEVRIAALNGIRLLDIPKRPSAAIIMPIALQDPEVAVRVEALYTLMQLSDWRSQNLQSLLQDSSPEVQTLALSMIENKN